MERLPCSCKQCDLRPTQSLPLFVPLLYNCVIKLEPKKEFVNYFQKVNYFYTQGDTIKPDLPGWSTTDWSFITKYK